jgi:hypothetical protein
LSDQPASTWRTTLNEGAKIMSTFHLDSRGGHGGTAGSSMIRSSTTVTMGHAFAYRFSQSPEKG